MLLGWSRCSKLISDCIPVTEHTWLKPGWTLHLQPCAQTHEISLYVDAKRKHKAQSWTDIKDCRGPLYMHNLWIATHNTTYQKSWTMSHVTLNTDISNKACSKFQQDLGPDMSTLEVSCFHNCLIVAHHWEGKRDKDIEDASNHLGYQYSNVFEESTYKSYSFSLFALRKSSFQKNCVILRTFRASILVHECKHF